MRRKLIYLLFAMFALLSWQGNAQVSIGTGSETNQSLPIEPYYGYSYSQVIYLASEINASGDITTLTWKFNGNSDLADSNDWTIYIGHTTKSDFIDGDDWIDVSTLTQVFSGTITPDANNDVIIDITDFTYNGTDNLVIAVDENKDSYDSGSDEFYCTQVSDFRAIEYHNDNTNPDPASPPSGNARTYIANIVLGGIQQACPTPTDLVVNNYTTTTADVSWTDNAGGSASYIVEWRETGTSTWNSATTAAGATSYQIQGLTERTHYEWQLTTDCGNNVTSNVANGPEIYTWYCESVPTSNDNDGIEQVVIGSETYTVPDVTYQDFTTTGTIPDLAQTAQATVEITFDTGYTYNANIWIDFNDNLEFESSELVFQGESTSDRPTTLDASFTMDSNAPLGNHVMRIGTADSGQATPNPCYNGSYGVTLDFMINVTDPPSCLAPTDLTVSNISADTADLTWTDNNSGNSTYLVEWREAGASTWNSDTTAAGATSYQITGLTAHTGYEWQITADCGNNGTSTSVTGENFMTACDVITAFPYNYGFENVVSNSGGDWSASCWSGNPENTGSSSSEGPYRWTVTDGDTPSGSTGPNAAQEGTQYAYTEASYSNEGDVAELYSPIFDMTSLTTPQISFYYHMYGENMGELHLDTYDGSSWTNDVWTISGQQQTSSDDPWTKVDVEITSSVTQIRFRAVRGNGYKSDMAVDGISIDEAPTCLVPTDLARANVSGGEVDLSWTDTNASAPSNGWEYEIIDVTAGETFTGVGVTVTSPNVHVTGLTVDDEYAFKVRALCDANDTSNWSSEFTWYQTEAPGCATNPTPADGATEITAGYEYISWDAPTTGGAATEYEVYFGTDANNLFDVGSLTDTYIDGTGLQANTTYYWKIVPKNNGGEAENCPVWSFTTQAPPPAPQGVSCNDGYPGAIFTEEFDTQGDWTGDIGSNDLQWHFGQSGGTSSYSTGPSGAYSGDYYMYFESSSPNQGTIASAVSPAIDLTNQSVAELSFYMYAYGEGMGDLNVGIGTDPAGPFTTVFTYGALQNSSNDPWVPVGIDISAYAGQVIYIQFTEESTGDYHGDMAIDKLEVTGCVACPEATDLIVENTTLNSAMVIWTDNTQGNEPYIVKWREVGTTTWLSSGTLPAGTNSYIIDGLSEKTHYEWKVFTNCSANGNGVTGPVYGPEIYTWYCDSVPINKDGDGITQIILINELYSVPSNTYVDLTDQSVANLVRGDMIPMSIDFATGYTYDTNIWIDFNNDLVFDSTELVFQGESASDNPTTLDTSFPVDAMALTGEHIMRIGTADSGQATPNPCYNGSWGVTVDLRVNIVCPTIDTFPYEYGFEDMPSSFISDWSMSCWHATPNNAGSGEYTGPYRWVTTENETSSPNTGPNMAHSGAMYAFTEASGYTNEGDETELISPNFDMSSLNSPMISFYYHMFGSQMGSLHLDTYDGVNWTNDVWSISGQQQQSMNDEWILNQIPIDNNVVKFRFRAIRGIGTRGDIAIDDIKVSETCYVPENLNVDAVFDTSATVSWEDASNASASYVIEWRELGGSTWNQDTTASGATSYTITGLNNSTLYEWRMYASCGNTPSETIEGTDFQTLCAAISSFPYNYGFEDMYPDVVSDWSASCWNATPDMAGTGEYSGPFRWLANTGQTSSPSTGPADAQEGTMYAFTEASGYLHAGDVTELYSPQFDMSNLGAPQISFYYHMYGNQMGSLHLDTFDGSTWTNDVWSISGQQQTNMNADWVLVEVPISSDVVRFRFRGVRGNGTRGDMAIDNIEVADTNVAPVAENPQANANAEASRKPEIELPEVNMVNIYQNEAVFNLQSMDDHNITGVKVYDLSGRLLFNNNNYNDRLVQIELQNISTGNLLIFVVQLDNGNSITKKAVKK